MAGDFFVCEEGCATNVKTELCKEKPAARSSLWEWCTLILGILCLLLVAVSIALGLMLLEKMESAAEYTAQNAEYAQELNRTRANLTNTVEALQRWRVHAGPRLHCPTGWALRNATCYYKSTEKQDWPSSMADCVKRGAHLVTTYDNTWEFFRETPFWLGAVTTFQKNVWLITKHVLSADISVDKQYVEIDGYWYKCGARKEAVARGPSALNCGEKHLWICERDATFQPLI